MYYTCYIIYYLYYITLQIIIIYSRVSITLFFFHPEVFLSYILVFEVYNINSKNTQVELIFIPLEIRVIEARMQYDTYTSTTFPQLGQIPY